VDAENVHLEGAPPVVRVELPRRSAAVTGARVGDEEIHGPELGEPAFDVLSPRHVSDEAAAAERRRDRLYLLGGAPADGDLHPGCRELARDVLADSAAAAGHERLLPAQLGHGGTLVPRREVSVR
jgi:hypothetical protein